MTWTTPPIRASGPGYGHGGADGGQSAQGAGAGVAGSTAGANWQVNAHAPAVLPYHDGPVPDGYVVQSQSSSVAMVAGGLIFAIPYAAGLGIAAADGFANGSAWLAAPVLGPWLALSGRDDPCASIDTNDRRTPEIDSAQVGRCVGEPIVRGLLVIDGVLQATGAVLMVVGYTNQERKFVRTDLAGLKLTPARVGGGWGVGGAGRF